MTNMLTEYTNYKCSNKFSKHNTFPFLADKPRSIKTDTSDRPNNQRIYTTNVEKGTIIRIYNTQALLIP
jgi:hypothetical protein